MSTSNRTPIETEDGLEVTEENSQFGTGYAGSLSNQGLVTDTARIPGFDLSALLENFHFKDV